MSKPLRRAKRAGYVESAPRCKTCAWLNQSVRELQDSVLVLVQPPTCGNHGHYVRRSGWCRDWAGISETEGKR